jgi:hypothetical protein
MLAASLIVRHRAECYISGVDCSFLVAKEGGKQLLAVATEQGAIQLFDTAKHPEQLQSCTCLYASGTAPC